MRARGFRKPCGSALPLPNPGRGNLDPDDGTLVARAPRLQ